MARGDQFPYASSEFVATVSADGGEHLYTADLSGFEFDRWVFWGDTLVVHRLNDDGDAELIEKRATSTAPPDGVATLPDSPPATVTGSTLASRGIDPDDGDVGHLAGVSAFGDTVAAVGYAIDPGTFDTTATSVWTVTPDPPTVVSGTVTTIPVTADEYDNPDTSPAAGMDGQAATEVRWRTVRDGDTVRLVRPLAYDSAVAEAATGGYLRDQTLWHGMVTATSDEPTYEDGEDSLDPVEIEVSAEFDAAGQLRFSEEYTGPLPLWFWDECEFTYGYDTGSKGDGEVHLWRYYGSGGHVAAGDFVGDGTHLEGASREAFNAAYRFYGDDAGVIGLLVINDAPGGIPDGITRPLPTWAKLTATYTPEVAVNTLFARDQYTFTNETLIETSTWDSLPDFPNPPGADLAGSAWIEGAAGFWSAVVAPFSRIYDASDGLFVDNYSIAFHYFPSVTAGFRRIFPRPDGRAGGARRGSGWPGEPGRNLRGYVI